MSKPPTNPTWRAKLTLAAIAGAVSGTVRALIIWALQD
jgi:hypothetical protein